MRSGKFFIACMLVLLIAGSSAFAQTSEPSRRDTEKEQAIVRDLQRVAPDRVGAFVAATEAMDREDFGKGVELFQSVLKGAAQFDPAVRRLAFCLAGTGRAVDAIAMAEKAVGIKRSQENLIASPRFWPIRRKTKKERRRTKPGRSVLLSRLTSWPVMRTQVTR